MALNLYNTRLLDGCNYTVSTHFTDPSITTEWPETNLGDTASVPCPCAEFASSLAGRAYRYCSGTFSQGAHWDMLDISKCEALNKNTTKRLCQAALLLAMVLNQTYILINNPFLPNMWQQYS